MNLEIYNQKGKKLDRKVSLDSSVFAAPINNTLLRTAVHVYLSNQRQGNSSTKDRSMVRGGGAKPWAQKGTGRARQGSIRSPLWKGGGVTFGPRGETDYSRKLTKKMKKVAVRSAFSYLAANKRIIGLDAITFRSGHLTKQLVSVINALPVKGRILFLHSGSFEKLYLAGRNIKDVSVLPVNEISVYPLLKHNYIVLLEDTIPIIHKFWAANVDVKEEPAKVKTAKEKAKAKTTVKKDFATLGLSNRILAVLKKGGVTTIAGVREVAQGKKAIPGLGEKSIEKLKQAVK